MLWRRTLTYCAIGGVLFPFLVYAVGALLGAKTGVDGPWAPAFHMVSRYPICDVSNLELYTPGCITGQGDFLERILLRFIAIYGATGALLAWFATRLVASRQRK